MKLRMKLLFSRPLLWSVSAGGLLFLACLYTYRLETQETHPYSAVGISALSVKTKNGSITAHATSDTTITVDVTKFAYGRDQADAAKAIANVVYSDLVVGGELRVKADMPSGPRAYGANFVIATPKACNLDLSTTNGNVSIANAVGDISVSAANGNIELNGTVGSAQLATTNGGLNVRVHRGAIDGSTTNGRVDCDLVALSPTESAELSTTNGDVVLLLPADVSALIDATNTNGMMTIHDFTVVYEKQTRNHLRGRIGSGASVVTLTTTNGDITVRRR